jgi:hypothetical protein
MPGKKALPRFERKSSSKLSAAQNEVSSLELVQPELISTNLDQAAFVVAENSIPTAGMPANAFLKSVSLSTSQKRWGCIGKWLRALSDRTTALGRWLCGVAQCSVWLMCFRFRKASRSPVQPRQPDLPRLDAVRVIRNDLSDSDFEVVSKHAGTKMQHPSTTNSDALAPRHDCSLSLEFRDVTSASRLPDSDLAGEAGRTVRAPLATNTE